MERERREAAGEGFRHARDVYHACVPNTVIGAAVRCQPLLRLARTLVRTKANFAGRGDTIEMRWHNGVFRFPDDGVE